MFGRSMIRLVACAAVSVGLSGCLTLEEFTGRVDTAVPQVEAVVSQVSAITQKLCGFEPFAATVLNLFTAGSLAGPVEIADRICAAIKAQPLAADLSVKKRIPVSVVVQNVRVDGHLTIKTRRRHDS